MEKRYRNKIIIIIKQKPTRSIQADRHKDREGGREGVGGRKRQTHRKRNRDTERGRKREGGRGGGGQGERKRETER